MGYGVEWLFSNASEDWDKQLQEVDFSLHFGPVSPRMQNFLVSLPCLLAYLI